MISMAQSAGNDRKSTNMITTPTEQPVTDVRVTPVKNKPKFFKNRTLHVWMTIEKSPRQALVLVDTGACVSIMPKCLYESISDAARQPLCATTTGLKAGNNTEVTCYGTAEIAFKLNGKSYKHVFHVCDDAAGVTRRRTRAAAARCGRCAADARVEWQQQQQ